MGDEYFVRIEAIRPAAPSVPPAAPMPPPVAVEEIAFADGSGRGRRITQVVLIAFGGIAAGMAFVLAAFLLQLLFLFLSEPFTRNEWMVIYAIGGAFALGGIVLAVVVYRLTNTPASLTIAPDRLLVRYPAFRSAFMVPRDAVRVISIDARPALVFQNNKRFPVRGPVPGEAFKDALDNFPKMPWAPFDDALPIVPGMTGEHDPHLFSADGTSLPVLRMNAEDVPNIAVIFDHPVQLPRRNPAVGFGPCSLMYLGPRRVRGLMMRVSNTMAAEMLLEPWGVVREITADDVLTERLFLPKPLRGWRILVFAGLLLAMVVMRIVVESA